MSLIIHYFLLFGQPQREEEDEIIVSLLEKGLTKTTERNRALRYFGAFPYVEHCSYFSERYRRYSSLRIDN